MSKSKNRAFKKRLVVNYYYIFKDVIININNKINSDNVDAFKDISASLNKADGAGAKAGSDNPGLTDPPPPSLP